MCLGVDNIIYVNIFWWRNRLEVLVFYERWVILFIIYILVVIILRMIIEYCCLDNVIEYCCKS